MPPLVSVNIPCYNCEKYIKSAIDSILQQSYSNIEVIVVNDGSTDSSASIVKQCTDKRIKLIENKVNMGVVATRNTALEASSGEFIAILDGDDISYPTRIEKQVKYLCNNPEFAMVGSWLEVVDSNGTLTGEIRKTPAYSEILSVQMLFQNCFGQSTVMAKRSIINKYMYSSDYRQAEDYDLWLRITNDYKTSNLQEPLVKYRVHHESISTNTIVMNDGIKYAINAQLGKIGIKPDAVDLNAHLVLMGILRADEVPYADIIIWVNKLYKHLAKLGYGKEGKLKCYFTELISINSKKYPLNEPINRSDYIEGIYSYKNRFLRYFRKIIEKTLNIK